MRFLLDELKIKPYMTKYDLINQFSEECPEEIDGLVLIKNYIFGLEFRSKKYILKIMKNMIKHNKEFNVLLTSSKNKNFDVLSIANLIKFVLKSRRKWVIIDIYKNKKMYINYNFKLKNKQLHRRKRIYGKK